MNNPYFAEGSRPGPHHPNAPGIIPSSSKRSFHTTSSDSGSEFADTSAHSLKSEKRKISPVFNDYGTAHSLITSGKARNLSAEDRDQYLQRASSSSSDSAQQLLLMNKGNDKFPADLQVPPAAAYRRDSGKSKHEEYDDDEDDGKFQIPQTYIQPSSPQPSAGMRPKRPQTPLIPKLWDVNYTSANRPPLAGGRLSAVQWPSNNPWNEHSPHARLSRKSSGILSPPDEGVGSEAYSVSKYGNTKNPYYSSPHGLPSPIVSGSGSGSSREPRSSYYPAEGIRVDGYDAGVRHGDDQMQRNFVFEPLSHYTEQQESHSSRSVPQQSDGSTVNHILDHYTHASDGSYYADGTRGAIAQPHQTPASSRRLGNSEMGSAAVTPSTEEEEEEVSDLSLRRFPDVPSPAYLRAASSGNVGSSSYGDSRELLGTYQQSERLRNSAARIPKAPRSIQIAKGRRIPPSDLGRQVSDALRDFENDDSYVEVSSPVIKKPIAAKKKLQLRNRKPVSGSFQNTNSSRSGHSSDDGTIRHKEPNNEKENVPPSSDDRDFESARFAEDYRVQTFQNKDGSVIRKVSKRKGAVHEEDDQDEWETIIESGADASPYAKLPYPKGRLANYLQTGSSIANVSDRIGGSSSGPIPGLFTASHRVIVHPARGDDQYDKHARPLPDGSGYAFLPVPRTNRHGNGGLGSNAFRTPHKLMRSLSAHLSSPLASSSPRHEYLELEDIKKGTSSPYSPGRKGKAPMRHESMSSVINPQNYVGLRQPTAPWTDGPQSSHGTDESNAGFQFGLNQRPERPDSYMHMIMAANGGKWPKFIQEESPSQSPAPERMSSQESPEPYAEPYPETPRIQYPPRVHSTSNSIADYSDTEVSHIDSLNGPEYDALPASNNGRSPYTHHHNARFDSSGSSPQTESAYADRSKVSQKPLAPGGLYSTLRNKYGSRRKSRPRDLEMGPGPDAASSPQSNKGLRPFIMRPSVIQPRSYHEFHYRSPLAPIKSKTWEPLYSRRKLERINNLTIRPAVEPPVIAHMTPNGTRMSSATSWQVEPVSPHLHGWPHENSSMGGFAKRKQKISNTVLLICCTNPLLLLLFATGLLDQIMFWYTKGDVRRFGRSQKKRAGWILIFFACAAILATVVILVVKARQSEA